MGAQGKKANEISIALTLLSSSARVWRNVMQLHVASLDLGRAFDRVWPPLLNKVLKDFATHPTLATAMPREQLGGKNDSTDRRHRFRHVHQTERKGEPSLQKTGYQIKRYPTPDAKELTVMGYNRRHDVQNEQGRQSLKSSTALLH